MSVRKPAADPRQAALETLSVHLADVQPKVLFGTKAMPGFFSGSGAAVKNAAELCVGHGWLRDTGLKNGTGKSAKNLYELTAAGRQAILENNPTRKLLESLQQSLKSQLDELQKAAQTLHSLESKTQVLKDVVHDVVAQVRSQPALAPNGQANRQVSAADLEAELTRHAQGHGSNNPITLPALFKEASSRWPHLSLGEFHDGVRRLWKQGRIQLGPYTRSYGVIAGDHEALFLDGQVMYYAYASA